MRADLAYANVGHLVQRAGESYGDCAALIDGAVNLSFVQLAEEVRRSAKAFIAAGVDHGDRVAIWAPNSARWVVAALGALSAGAALVPLNTRYKGAEAAYALTASRATVLVCSRGFLGSDHVAMLSDAGFDATALAVVDLAETSTSMDEFLTSGSGMTDAELAERTGSITADDLSDVMFTSGTTGRPKGAMLTHGQTLRVFDDWCDLVGLRLGDRYLIVNPFFHTFGYKAGIIACLLRGATMFPLPVFDVDEVVTRVALDRISVLPGPPTLFQSILNLPNRDQIDLSSLRLAITGAAVVPVEMIRRMFGELGFETVLTGYGLTETNGTATMCRVGDPPELIAVSCGCAVPGSEIRVVRPDGSDVVTGEAGEVLVRGYQVMVGYLDDPLSTAATIDRDGWLRTGDIGVMDENGYLRITDRLKDMLIVGGFNVYPAEIEQAMAHHPGVGQVAVVATHDERMGEVGVAYIVQRSGVELDLNELQSWCRGTMANFKVPRHFLIVDALPVNASGKVDKLDLRERARALGDTG